MEGITYGDPEPFTLPSFDYAPVKAAVRAVDLTRFYDNLLDDAFTRDVEDFTCEAVPYASANAHLISLLRWHTRAANQASSGQSC